MSGVAPDPLDRIGSYKPDDYGIVVLSADEHEALVEVARAARAYTKAKDDEWCRDGKPEYGDIPPWQGATLLGELFRALARLNKDVTPPEADPALIKKWNPA